MTGGDIREVNEGLGVGAREGVGHALIVAFLMLGEGYCVMCVEWCRC